MTASALSHFHQLDFLFLDLYTEQRRHRFIGDPLLVSGGGGEWPSAACGRLHSLAEAGRIVVSRVHIVDSMSCVAVKGSEDACANCEEEGSEGGAVKLKNCTACRLVKYCGVDCQRAHRRQQHKDACRQRVAELKDYRLYSQGHERLEGDFCLICSLSMTLPTAEHSGFNVCCMKRVCVGCNFAARKEACSTAHFVERPIPRQRC
ncbi:hypothetical protein THAOC_35166 [Thalassiosira oceanica]|uniref:MYND-type domain-containing protein n=1 Tax=Thalassiosira oceanica TaxID=159749 RepID=K0R2B0_THAOC|nr:hypothetical protein THAOC_35166 [Thalassiosira oceanica]|eukprot:EJK46180.1 hypothetical protein THAOC_35166 [Thalassiosira oceanica]